MSLRHFDIVISYASCLGVSGNAMRLELIRKVLLVGWLVGLVGFYDISTLVGYLTPNSFLCKKSVLFQTIQFRMSTQFNCQKHFYF